MSIRDRYTIKDDKEQEVYQIEGSIFEIPKKFFIRDMSGKELAMVWKKPISFFPKFFLEVGGQEVAMIQKEFSFFKPRYSIQAQGIEVQGDIWDMSFELFKNGRIIGRVNKKWLSIRDTYAIEVENEEQELLVLGIVLAIDYVKKMEQANSASGGA
jgi:uncharacterized protein YxjI